MTAVQQLTRLEYQGRVISLLESLAKAAPALGFVMGGVSTALLNPRVSYVLAGAGVLAVLAVASVALARTGWRGEAPQGTRLSDDKTLQRAANAGAGTGRRDSATPAG
jgi:hypothetical protein